MEAFLGEGCRRRCQGCRWARRGPRNARWCVLRVSPRDLRLLHMAQAADGELVIIVLGKVVEKPPIQADSQGIMTRQGGSTGLPVEDLRHEDRPWKTRCKRVPALYGCVVQPVTIRLPPCLPGALRRGLHRRTVAEQPLLIVRRPGGEGRSYLQHPC